MCAYWDLIEDGKQRVMAVKNDTVVNAPYAVRELCLPRRPAGMYEYEVQTLSDLLDSHTPSSLGLPRGSIRHPVAKKSGPPKLVPPRPDPQESRLPLWAVVPYVCLRVWFRD